MQVSAKSGGDFIIIGKKTYFCDQIRVGKAKTSIYLDGKRFIKVPTWIINAYAQGGNLYEYLSVLNKNQDRTEWAFMQFITTRDGNRLYRYCSNCLHYDPVSRKIEPIRPVYRYYTFRKGVFVSVTDDNNVGEIFSLFGLKVIN